MKTATFKNLIEITYEEPKRKNGKRKPVYHYADVIEELHPVGVKFNGKIYQFYLRDKDIKDFERTARGNMGANLYHEDGTIVYGIWKHGRYGSHLHEEPLKIWMSSRNLQEHAVYQNGRSKDSYKYLLSIVEK